MMPILAHLDLHEGIRPRALAAHLSVAPSTLSAALERLARLGYITNLPKAEDKRQREIWLTKEGAQAMAATSVLDAARVRQLLEKLSVGERKQALEGIALLARAARALQEKEKS